MAIDHYAPPTNPWLDILYCDQDIIAINKPAGLLSVPGRDPAHSDSCWNRVREQYPDCQVVHRLDMATSGLMILALHKQAERHLKIQFEQRIPTKLYYAKVWGELEAKEGLIDLPLICDWPNRPRQKVCFEDGKPSQTRYQFVKQEGNNSIVKLLPVTGRSHQLRVHMMSLGHPILGDEFYAHDEAEALSDRLQLHAAELCILHPTTEKPLHLFAPCDFYLNAPQQTLDLSKLPPMYVKEKREKRLTAKEARKAKIRELKKQI
ncbi:bifunctional tRNA pseudouridine(32) synthase/23S rRNA pseudouridine(746) synthase RluA [Vibrio sp. SS-MA-C1-2]|uniref:bifunctional tRNA pseudouridine(32) synthase/23S rRNA pseudouridine(746) synthase RluA n=1 Tax=Vibrio sp. SS-MA-C1-2 TaxID=2908646 RepID=UPI001F22BC54|nr:bifunctional tRNA pseudouridine(32) synthase/23S rRNA pseudouridine(746) synthase RluA [Vibrio sp. SS-MA-C1-2]UJF19576.1 bifunctional tRNA pseudouridine(32) synthase/23S rRNA pseudouridine(746) synthase RluA [Vibrio sp. SS-MA-C1-2]